MTGGFGWWRAFKIGYQKYPLAAILIFLTGLAAIVLELAAYGVIALGIELYQSQESRVFLGYEFAFPFSRQTLLIGTLVFTISMFSSALVSFVNGWLLARYRRITFYDTIRDLVNRLDESNQHPFVNEYGIRGVSRSLRREARYVGRAITDALTLPTPFIVIAIVGVLAIWKYPTVALIVILIVAISSPFHFLTGKWGAAMMEKLINSGLGRGQADKEIVETILQSPYRDNNDDSVDFGKQHADRPEVQKFLRYYEMRVRLMPISGLISRLSFLAIFIALGLYIGLALMQGKLTSSDVLILFVGVRFSGAALSQLASIITLVASYSPMISAPLDFLYDEKLNDQGASIPPIKMSSDRAPGKQIILISDLPVTWPSVQNFAKNWPAANGDIQLISSNYTQLPSYLDRQELATRVRKAMRGISKEELREIISTIETPEKGKPQAKAIIALAELAPRRTDKTLFIPAKSIATLAKDDLAIVLSHLEQRPTAIIHGGVPKRLPRQDGYEVWTLQNNVLTYFCKASEFADTRDKIVDHIEKHQTASQTDEADDMSFEDL